MCHIITIMAILSISFQPGQSIFDQLVSAAQKAILSGEMSAGQAFPSVRTLAADLKIHPNTAHKAVQYLIQERWLEMRPGIGTVVAGTARREPEMREQLLHDDVARIVAESKRLGLRLKELTALVAEEWRRDAAAVEVQA
jgi:GntR family transcriptional regulator